MKNARFLLLLFTLMLVVSCREATKETALMLYEQALEANAHDSIRQSEQLLHRAIRTAKAEGDHHTLYLSQLQLAQSLSWGNADAALDMARQALDTYKQHPDKARNHIIILDYIATYASQRAYNNDTSFDEALRYAQEAHRLSKAEGDSTLVSQTLTTLANIYWAMEQYPQALTHAREATRLAPPDLLLGAQQVLGRCLVSCDSLSEAENVYRHMDYGDDIQAAYIVESNLAKLALRRNDAEAAETAIDEAFERAETLYFKALGQKDDYYQASLRQDRENERLRYRQRLQGILLAGGLLLLIALAAIVRREIVSRRREKAFLRQEVETQREQLRQRDASVDFLKGIIYQRSEVVQKLSTHPDRHIVLTDKEWEEVEHMLDIIDNGRLTRLREEYPDMKEEDVQLCILTRLQLTNRTIGNVYAISISAVQHRKLRLKKEVFGENDPDITLEQVLEKI